VNTRIPAASNITTELLLEVFDLPVSFHRCLVPITGGVTAALMLSQAIWTTQEIDHTANGWFAKSHLPAGSRKRRVAPCAALDSWRSGASACRRSSGFGFAPSWCGSRCKGMRVQFNDDSLPGRM